MIFARCVHFFFIHNMLTTDGAAADMRQVTRANQPTNKISDGSSESDLSDSDSVFGVISEVDF